MPRIDDILAGIINGAHEAGATVERLATGREEKLAKVSDKMLSEKAADWGGGVGAAALGPLGAGMGAGIQDKSWGSAAGATGGSMLGMAGGGLAGLAGGGGIGALIAKLMQEDPIKGFALGANLGMPLGALAGMVSGGHAGQDAMRPDAKTANYGGLGGLLGTGAGMAAMVPFEESFRGHLGSSPQRSMASQAAGLGLMPAGAAIGAAMGADPGHRLSAAAGSAGGNLLGLGLGAALGGLTKHPVGEFAPVVGSLAGSTIGGHVFGHGDEKQSLMDRLKGKFGSAEATYLRGCKEAAARFKIASIGGLLGSLAAPALARSAAGHVAGGALGRLGGGAVGRAAGALQNAKGLGGMAVDMGASSLGQRMMS